MIAAGGNWLHSFFLSDIVPAVKIELANLVTTQTTALSDAWAGTSWFELTTAFGDAMSTLLIGTVMSGFIFLCLVHPHTRCARPKVLGCETRWDKARRMRDEPHPGSFFSPASTFALSRPPACGTTGSPLPRRRRRCAAIPGRAPVQGVIRPRSRPRQTLRSSACGTSRTTPTGECGPPRSAARPSPTASARSGTAPRRWCARARRA